MSRIATTVFIVTGIVISAIAQAQSAPQKLMSGDTKIEIVASYNGADLLPKPDKVLIYGFTVPADAIAIDDSAAAQIHRRRMLRRGSDDEMSPEVVARRVQAAFSKTLVSQLQKASVPSEIAADPDVVAPAHTLTVQGDFIAINEGNKSKRIMIGFGRGASNVQTHVTISLTTEAQPIVLSEFNLKSTSGKKPGAAATMGVGTAATAGVGAATGSVGDKKATVEGDASRMAKAVAKQIEALMIQQKWISPEPPKPN